MKDPANPLGAAAIVAGRARRGRAAPLRPPRIGSRPRRELEAEPTLSEDEAVERLYGARTGTVSASTSRPPVAPPR